MSIPRWLRQKTFKTKAEQAIGRTGLKPAYEPNVGVPQQTPVHQGLLFDPVSSLATAELNFATFQLSSGQELLRENRIPQTAGELQNYNLALEQVNIWCQSYFD